MLLFASPVELYPDEAQYWAWSRTLDWGYFSKPPMIAWLIRLSTALGGDAEAWVRLPAWACQVGASAFVFLATRRWWGARAGFWATVLYALAPGVALSSVVASTDAPLLLFLSAALWAYACLLTGRTTRAAAALGLCLGLAMLGKYAALYAAGALVLHAAVSRRARAAWSPRRLAVAVGAGALCVAPNLIWNATHGFETVSHTAANANWSGDLGNLGEAVAFLGEQFGVFGPIAFALLLAALLEVLRKGRLNAPARGATAILTLLPLCVVLVQAFLSRANANWAAAFLPSAAALTAAWSLDRSWGRLGLWMAAASQGALQLVLGAALLSPAVVTALGADNAFKRARGWAETARVVRERVAAEPNLTAIAVDDRFTFYALTYYGRDWIAAPGTPPLTAWVRQPTAQNEAEASHPLTQATGGRVLGVSTVPDYREEFGGRFARTDGSTLVRVPLDSRRTRDIQVFIGERFRPSAAPRQP